MSDPTGTVITPKQHRTKLVKLFMAGTLLTFMPFIAFLLRRLTDTIGNVIARELVPPEPESAVTAWPGIWGLYTTNAWFVNLVFAGLTLYGLFVLSAAVYNTVTGGPGADTEPAGS